MKPSERVFTQSVVFSCSHKVTSFSMFGTFVALLALLFSLTSADPTAAACMPTLKHAGDTLQVN